VSHGLISACLREGQLSDDRGTHGGARRARRSDGPLSPVGGHDARITTTAGTPARTMVGPATEIGSKGLSEAPWQE
jgi:hypothetical protein